MARLFLGVEEQKPFLRASCDDCSRPLLARVTIRLDSFENSIQVIGLWRLERPRLLSDACPMCAAQLPRMLIARDMTATMVAREIVLSSIISILARDVSGMTSVVLNAVAVEYPRNR